MSAQGKLHRWAAMSGRVILLTGLVSLLLSTQAARGQHFTPIDLAGQWRFALDREDVGVQEQWFDKDLPDQITLPGVLQAQGHGDEISTSTPWVLSLYDRWWYLRADYKAYTEPGNVKVPFLAQPPRHYLGAAWYQRDVVIPADWQEWRVVLTLERPHWETTVWVDERKIGSNNSLCVPHVYDLGTLSPGQHRLSIRSDNRMFLPYRPDAHSVSDSLAGTWNGIVGKIELTATTQVWLEDVQVYPNVAKKSVLLKVQIGNMTGEAGKGRLHIASGGGSMTVPVTWDAQGGQAEVEVELGPNAQTWDEFHPYLQPMVLSLLAFPPSHIPMQPPRYLANDYRNLTFGLRELHTEGNQFILNGRPIILRGTHSGGDFPLTGYPPTDVKSWDRIINICKAWGLNHLRFHSWAPPEAAYVAADKQGFYIQSEPGMWNEISPGTPMERMLYEETERMIKAYGNHPSYVMLSASNEPKGHWQEALPKWTVHFRTADPRRLYTNGTGHTEKEVPNLDKGVDYLVIQRVGAKQLRGNSAWFGDDYRASLVGVNVPVLAHELGQWAAYPDYDIIKKFTGYMRPGNYEIFRDSMAAHGLLAKDKDFAWASGRYQLACYKEEIEANLRTPGLGGFQLLDLHDYVGQGTALVGLLDPFWASKGYATPQEFRHFCNTTVPLARLKNRVLTTADPFAVDVEIAHYGAEPIAQAVPVWQIVEGRGTVVAKGQWPARTLPLGKNTPLGQVTVDLSRLPAPRAYKLVVSIRGTPFTNDWNFWLYPAQVNSAPPADVLVTSSWPAAEAKLGAGGKVLYLPRRADLDWTSPPLDVVPVFWNRFMGPNWSRMLGLWCDTHHPALAGFPTEANFDWQWTELVRRARAVNLDRFPRELQPIVWAIDDWNRNYKLGLIFEAKVGHGRLLVCAADIQQELDSRPAARQLRRSLFDYMTSVRFQPRMSVSAADMRGLLFDTLIMRKLGATAQAEGQAANVIDGDPNTFWQAGDQKQPARQTQELTVNFPAPVAMNGLVLMSRQNHREHEGDIREYVVQVSDDGREWREAARGTLRSTFAPQQIRFPQTRTVRQLKLTALSGFGPDKTAALAELAVIYAGPKLPDTGADALNYQRSKTATPDIDEGTAAPRPPATQTPQRKPSRRRRPG